MKTTIDAAGRVVVPKQLRIRLGLTGGTEVEVGERDGAVEIRPVGREVILSQDSHGCGSDGASRHASLDR